MPLPRTHSRRAGLARRRRCSRSPLTSSVIAAPAREAPGRRSFAQRKGHRRGRAPRRRGRHDHRSARRREARLGLRGRRDRGRRAAAASPATSSRTEAPTARCRCTCWPEGSRSSSRRWCSRSTRLDGNPKKARRKTTCPPVPRPSRASPGGSIVSAAPNVPPPPTAAPSPPRLRFLRRAAAPPAPTPPPQSLFDVHRGSLRLGVPVPDVRPVFSLAEQRQYGMHAETELRMPMLHMTF